MGRIKVALAIIVASVFILIYSASGAVIQGLTASGGVSYIYYSGNVKCHKIVLTNPYRVAIDLVGVDKCIGCRNGIKILKEKGVLIRMDIHAAPDSVYNLYGKPTARVVYVLNSVGTKKPVCEVNRRKGVIQVIYATDKVNVLQRISLRKFKKYEMVVVLLSKKPTYTLTKTKNKVILVVDNVTPTPQAIQYQNLSLESRSVNSIEAAIVGGNVKYVIKMKKGSELSNYYADNRHIYLVFSFSSGISRNQEGAVSMQADNVKPKINNVQKNGILGMDKKISFDVRDAQLKDIFRVFAQISGLNFIIGQDVKGTLTMRLKDVPLEQAFDLILQQEGLVAERKGNIVIIQTAAKYQQEKLQQLKALQDKEMYERMKNAITKVINLNYITPDYAIKMINKLLYNGNDKGGFVVADVKNNALICHDTPQNIAKIEKIVKMIDKKKVEVEIDARIVEISKNFERQIGIQWGGNYFNNKIRSSNAFIAVGGATSPVDITGGLPPAESFVNNNYIVNLPASLSAAPTSAVTLAIGNVLANYNLDLKLTMGEIEGYTKVLSSPKIITLDNEPAKIESGQQIPYQQTAGASGATSVSFKSATLSLEVTPHVTKNNQVILNIKVKKDSPDYSHSVGGEPPINTNQVETTVILKNGQTLVIGGLLQRTSEKTVSGVPGLMRIPLLGWLFKTERIYNPQTELYIFVTPHILKNQ